MTPKLFINSRNIYFINALKILSERLEIDFEIIVIFSSQYHFAPCPRDLLVSDSYEPVMDVHCKMIIISSHHIPFTSKEILPDLYLLNKHSTLDLVHEIISRLINTTTAKKKYLFSKQEIIILQSFSQQKYLKDLCSKTNLTSKQVYYYRRRLMRKFNLTRPLMTIFCNIILKRSA
jgi:DNA-binding CsgD family transcriptional regulator